MKEQVNRSRPRSSTPPTRNPLSDLAIEVSTRMSHMNGIPSVSMMVVSLTEVRDRLPREFDEQITLLKAIARNLEIYISKPGAEILVSGLEQMIRHLELCGEIPCYGFEVVVARLHQMNDFEARRYLEGIDGLARKDRWGGAERRLLALLNYSTDDMLPFDWSEGEWKDFDRLVERNQARIRELTGELAVPSAPAVAAAPPLATGSSSHRRMEWKGELTDLVFVIQALKDAGLLDPGTTDAAVVDCIDFESEAVDRVGLIVNARNRLVNEQVFVSPDLIERLRHHLSQYVPPRITRRKRRRSKA